MNPHDVALSKTLSWLLRHGAHKEKLTLSPDGFINVHELLQHPKLRHYTVDDIKRVVESNDKQRFALRTTAGSLQIRANQGHSIEVRDLELTRITDPALVSDVIHGTYMKLWPKIKVEGLKRMNRIHIHFASGLPEKGNDVISGVRQNAEICIYINLAKALKDGLKFFKSVNGVILSPGNEQGIIEPKYFLKVCTRNGKQLQ